MRANNSKVWLKKTKSGKEHTRFDVSRGVSIFAKQNECDCLKSSPFCKSVGRRLNDGMKRNGAKSKGSSLSEGLSDVASAYVCLGLGAERRKVATFVGALVGDVYCKAYSI
jgi:hypothetical protein